MQRVHAAAARQMAYVHTRAPAAIRFAAPTAFRACTTVSASTATTKFKLDAAFVSSYRSRKPPFGFHGLGEFVFHTRYSRTLDHHASAGRKETWVDTVVRVCEGTMDMQRKWLASNSLPWDAAAAQARAQDMFARMFAFKFLPPGRGLWAMGTPITEERGLFAALNNCAFVSTRDMATNPSHPFAFLMDASMLGVGVGFDTAGAGSFVVRGALPSNASSSRMLVEDSREGWVASVTQLLDAHFHGRERPQFDYSAIRPRGAPIRGFGGTASGPDVLVALHAEIDAVLQPLAGQRMSITAIADVMNLIGKCVVSGDVRQTAEIAFGDAHSEEYINLKNYAVNPRRAAFGWTSNNSVYAPLGMSYDSIAQRVCDNGEPGFAWLQNMRRYGRMGDAPNDKDYRAAGGNPCLEQTLESFELCCLVETFPANHEDLTDFLQTLKVAYMYAKTVTLGKTHWPQTNQIMLRNRRIGTSLSGVAQFVAQRGLHELRNWCETGYATLQEYDVQVSEWLAVPRSIKTTCVKPSGTVSLLAGATPGLHHPESRFYLRRVRLGAQHELVAPLRAAGYAVEPAAEDPARKVVVTFPVDAGAGIRTLDGMTMWEQLGLAAFLQRHWADNQVSCTVTFDPVTEGPQLARALDMFQYQLKGVSFLPRTPAGAYKQMPYEAITEAEYKSESARLRPLDLSQLYGQDVSSPDKFCDSTSCDVAP